MIDGVRRIAVLEDGGGVAPAVLGNARRLRREEDPRAAAVGGNPHLRVPRHDPAGGIEARPQVEQLLRALRIPSVLVLTRPLDAHRLADRLRQEHGVGRRVVGAVGAIRSRSLDEHDTHLLGHEAEDARQRGSHPVGDLRRRPDRRGVAANVCDGTRRRKRRVTLTRPEVCRRHRRLRRRQRRLERGRRTDRRRRLAPMVRGSQLPGRARRRPRADSAPGCRAPAARATCVHFALSSRDALTAAHSSSDTTARKLSTRTTRTPGSCATEASSTETSVAPSSWRPDHAAVEHAGNAEVLDVLIAARALGRDLGPRR